LKHPHDDLAIDVVIENETDLAPLDALGPD
jgi:hypothetical protein